MNTKHNINYFKKTDLLKFLGIGMLIVGFFLYWFGWGYFSYIVLSVSIPSGLVLFLVGSSGRSDDNDIEACIKEQTAGLEANLEENSDYKKRILKHLPPEVAEGYEYEQGMMLKKAKNGSVRSSEYTKAIVYMLSDELYITCRSLSLISENTKNRVLEIPYGMIHKVEIVRAEKDLTFMKKSFHVSTARLSIEYGDGLLFSTPIHESIQTDQLVEQINKMVSEHKKNV